MIKTIGLALLVTSPLSVATIATVAISGATVSAQNIKEIASKPKLAVQNSQYMVELSKEQQSYFSGEYPLSPQQIEFIRENNNGDDLNSIRAKIAKGEAVKITTDVKREIIDAYYTKGFFNQQSLKFYSYQKSVDYPVELQKELDGTPENWIATNKKVIQMWKAGKFRFPWDSADFKVADKKGPVKGKVGEVVTFTSDIDKYPHQIYMINKTTNLKISLINDVHSIVYQTDGKQTDGAIAVNRRINPSKKANFRFLNKVYDNTKAKPGEFETSFDTFAVDQRETNLMVTELNKYSANQAAFLVMKKKPKFETTFNYEKVSSFYPANIEHFIVPIETDEWKIVFEQVAPKEKILVKSFSSATKTKPLNVAIKKTDGTTFKLNKHVRYVIFNKKESDTDEATLAMSRSFSDTNFKYINKVLRNGEVKDSKRKHDNVLADVADSTLIKNSKNSVAPTQVIGLVLGGDLSDLPTDISAFAINGFYPVDQTQKFLPLSGSNYEIEFELETAEAAETAAPTSPWHVNNIGALRSKIYYDGKKLNQAYMIGYKPKNGLFENQLSGVWFGKTLHLEANYWAMNPNGIAGGKNGKKNNDKFSIEPADQEIIRSIITTTPEEEFGFLLVEIKSLPKAITDTLDKVKIYKENNGKKKQFEYVVIKTSDPKTTIAS